MNKRSQAFSIVLTLLRRPVIAVCITLAACAAAPAERGDDAASGTAYGAFLAARYADRQQDLAAASTFYQQALRADPRNGELAAEDFVDAVLAGAPDAATLARRNLNNALAVMLLANTAAAAGDYRLAGQEYAVLSRDDPTGLIQPLLLAWSAAGEGDETAAVAELTPYFSAASLNSVYVLNAALISDVGGDARGAATYYSAVGGSGAVPNLRLAQILASWQARQGQTEGAEAQLDGLIAAHPDLRLALPALRANIAKPVITKPTDGLAEAYLTLAGVLDQPSQTILRMTFLRFALALRPDLSAARLLLASVQTGDGGTAPVLPAQLNAALATLRPVPPDDPLYAVAAMQQAVLLSALNQPDQAVSLLEKLAAADPRDPAPFTAAGDVLRGDNQFAASVGQYDKAVALIGQPPPPEAWSLFYNRGIAEDQAGNWKAAQPDLMEALSLAPNQPYVLNYIAYTWALHGEKLDQAHQMLQQAVGLDPNDGAVIDSLGYVSLLQGQNAAAIKLLTQATELDPEDAEVNAHLGDAFWATGMKLQARYQWQRALSLQPDPKLQSEIEDKLKQAGLPG